MESKVLKREWTTREGWRDTKVGMWAWLIQRGAAVGLLVVIVLHLANPFRRPVQAALLALALLHALLGVRSLLLDCLVLWAALMNNTTGRSSSPAANSNG